MAVVAFIDPPQCDVIDKILRGHQSGAMVGGPWRAAVPKPPPDVEGLVHDLDGCFTDSLTGCCDQA